MNEWSLSLLTLKKLKGYTVDDLDILPPLQKWGLFFKFADNPEKQDIINTLIRKEHGIMDAQKTLSKIGIDYDLWFQQTGRLIQETDERSDINGAFDKGIQQGLQQ